MNTFRYSVLPRSASAFSQLSQTVLMSNREESIDKQPDFKVGKVDGLLTSHTCRSNDEAPAHSPLYLHGDEIFHSFTACGAPDCKLCTKNASGRWQALFGSRDNWTKRYEGGGVGKPRRSLILQTCEHCRMPYIPKGAATHHEAEEEDSDALLVEAFAASTMACGVHDVGFLESCSGARGAGEQGPAKQSEWRDVILKNSPAGGSTTPSSPAFSFVTAEKKKEDGKNSGHVRVKASNQLPLVSSSESQQSCVSSERTGEISDEEHDDLEGFCSGDCKMSHILLTPMAVRQQRMAAMFHAAAYAMQMDRVCDA